MIKFTKADIVDAIYNRTGINRKEIRDVVDLFIDEVKSALAARKAIELRGFGTFEIKIRKGRQKARNPKTGEILSVNSHGIAAFRPGRELKRDVWALKPEAEAECPAGSGAEDGPAGGEVPPQLDRGDGVSPTAPEAALSGGRSGET